jgi:OOP family OmpA-OmpF porin
MKNPNPLRSISLAVFALLGLQTAQAQSALGTLELGYPYLGLDVGQTRASLAEQRIVDSVLPMGVTGTVDNVDKKATSYRVFLGYQFNRYIATELGFFNLGKYGFSSTTAPAGNFNGQIKYRGIDLDLVGTLPVTDNLSLLARGGIRQAKANAVFTGSSSSPVTTADRSESGANYKVGAGLQYAFSPHFVMRGEVDRYKVSDLVDHHGSVTVFAVSFIVPFGHAAAPRPVAARMVEPPAPMVAEAAAPAPVVAAEPPPMAEPERRRVTYSVESLFNFDSTALRPEGKSTLDGFVRDLVGTRFDTVSVEGHTDRLGTPEYNQTLSQQRADVVKSYLVDIGRVDAAKISSVGKSESMPMTKAGDCRGSDQNNVALVACLQPDRRVEIEVVGTKR